jgi:pyruvate dehydrogenase E2 component (dihydrolipoamide acetyltransferase)
MATDVVMPQMGESIFEGTITKWLKKPGEKVQRDEPLFEISTDKVDAEIPAPASGVLSEIKVPEGSTVQVNTVVGVIDGDGTGKAAPAAKSAGGSPSSTPAAPAQASPAQSAATTKGGAASTDGGAKPAVPAQAEGASEKVQPPETEKSAELRPARTAAPTPSEEASVEDGERIRSSPVVRRLAKEHAINLAQVKGTGQGGRISKEDIEGFIAQQGQRSAAQIQGPAATRAGEGARATQPQLGPFEVPGDVVAMSPMRKKIAERMVESKRTSPHVHTIYEVDLTRVANLRARVRGEWERRNGTKMTFMPFVARATVAAIRQYPIINSAVEGDSIHYHRNINLGIAVALDWGLIVPVIRNAEELNFLGLQRAVNDLSERARSKRLKPAEVEAGTFTITNPGSIGGLIGLPIIMQPQVAILGTGGIKKQPVVVTDEDGNDSIAIRSIMQVVLGYDHRIIDGATAGHFLGVLKKFLESWNEDLG